MNVVCTNCGAQLDVDGSTPTPICAFCGTRNVLPEDVWQRVRPQVLMQPMTAPVVAPEKPSMDLGTKLVIVFGAIGAVAAVVTVIVMSKGSSAAPTAVAAPGSPCGATKSACASDGKSLLVCDGTKLVVALTCKGPNGCRVTDQGQSVSCDYTLADENDPCNVKDSTCSTDRKSELRCDGAKFVPVSACTGPDGCSVSPSNDGYVLSCDDHVAAQGAPCLEDGRFACTPDGKTMLRCTRGHFALASTCKGPGACKVSKNAASGTTTVACDGNVSDVGDPCEPDHTACASDKKTLLGCKDGVFVAGKRCPNGCAVVESGVQCR